MRSIGTVGGWRSTHTYRRYAWRDVGEMTFFYEMWASSDREVLGCEFVKVVDEGRGSVIFFNMMRRVVRGLTETTQRNTNKHPKKCSPIIRHTAKHETLSLMPNVTTMSKHILVYLVEMGTCNCIILQSMIVHYKYRSYFWK